MGETSGGKRAMPFYADAQFLKLVLFFAIYIPALYFGWRQFKRNFGG